MAAKAILVLCAQALLAQCVYSQCYGRLTSPCGVDRSGWLFERTGLAPSCGAVAALEGVAPASGGALPIASASPIPVSGLSVASENAIEGILGVTGNLPFVSAVALEGVLPTAGAGSVSYGCGDGAIGMVSAGAAPALGFADGLSFGPGLVSARDTIYGQGLSALAGSRIAAPFGINRALDLPLATNGLSLMSPAVEVATTSGGSLPIASASPIPPRGIAVASDNAIDGILAVTGNLPFVSAVALEGVLPTAGAGSVLYGCGDGAIGMVSAGGAPGLGYADGLGFGAGLAAPIFPRAFGRGCNAMF